ncbi:hypothetical protein C8R44DRAFT_738960 [Mycena epipterygia]|nr:hypothetical protein C8R44DRAFT_738960 [Mycena epipterygia]
MDEAIKNVDSSPCVRAAALHGHTMLNKYYALTDKSIVFHIAMILHPRYKNTYFVKAKWPWEWIKTAKDLVRHEWNTYYKPKEDTNSALTTAPKVMNKYFDALLETETDIDVLDDWLSSAPVMTKTDPITWWTGMEAAGHPMRWQERLTFLGRPIREQSPFLGTLFGDIQLESE